MQVHLRERKVKGRISFYLDIRINGSRKYEYLGLKVKPNQIKPSNREKRTRFLAEILRTARAFELKHGVKPNLATLKRLMAHKTHKI